jgi:crotonobetainyl-CoA:carnitine CoA-transferase CaiB-like acyl-CoA transferase
VTQLLAGVRVRDVTTVLAGPFAAYQLSLFGADVVKVEVPGGGDLARDMGDDEYLKSEAMGAAFLAQNSGKRSITVDLKSEVGREVFARLVTGADVLLENMRPGVLDRLGFSWARLHEINPALIYCAVSGFGREGPLAGRAAYDQIIQGLAGMAQVTGYPDGEPLRVGFPVCDTLGGYAAAMAVCAALVRRSRDGLGSLLDVSMLDAALTAMGWAVSEQLITGRDAVRHGNHNAASSPSGTFRTGDGLLTIAANSQAQFVSLCAVVEREDLLEDSRFATRRDRKRHRAALTEQLERALARHSSAHWEARLAAVSVPVGPILTLAEALDQDQVRSRGLIHQVDVGLAERASVSVLGSAVQVDGAPLVPSRRPPRRGEHTAQLLAEVGYADHEIEELRARRAV